MSEDRFLDQLRADAQALRYEPADVVTARLTAHIDERVRSRPTVTQLLDAWFRPVAASFAAIAVVALLSVSWAERALEPVSMESMAAAPAAVNDVAIDGETLGVD